MTCQNCKNISILSQILTILAPCNSHVTNLNIENKVETSHLYVLHLSNAKKIQYKNKCEKFIYFVKTKQKIKYFCYFGTPYWSRD